MPLEREEILHQLQKICESEDFRTKPLMIKFLTYVVNEHMDGRGDLIKGYNIGVDVFDQGEKFDPDHNALVRIHAGRLRRQLKLYYLDEGKNDGIFIDIPKGKYTPQVVLRELEENVASAITNNNSFPAKKIAISILPFELIPYQEAYSYLAFGLSQELSTILSKFGSLQVSGLTKILNSEDAEHQYLKELSSKNIDYYVSGTLQIIANNVRLNVKLSEVVGQNHLWSKAYSFKVVEEDIFEIQEKIARQIAMSIGSEYGEINKKRQQDLARINFNNYTEHDVLLKWYYYQAKLTEKSHDDYFQSLNTALEVNPNSAMLIALLASMHGDLFQFDFPNSENAYNELGKLAEKAFEIDPNNQIVKLILSVKCFVYNERERYFQLFDDAKEWAPSSPLLLGPFGMYSCLFGEWEIGKEILDNVYENNLDFPLYLYGVTCLYYYKDSRYEEALDEAKNYNVPDFFWGPMLKTACYSQIGNEKMATLNKDELLRIRPDISKRGRHLLGNFIKEEALVQHVIDGLNKADLNIE